MVHYKPVKITVDVLDLAKVIIDMIVCYYAVLESIVIDQGLLFTLKF